MLNIFKRNTKKETNYDKWLDELNIDVKLDNSPVWQDIKNAATLHKIFGEDPISVNFMSMEQKAVYNSIIALEA